MTVALRRSWAKDLSAATLYELLAGLEDWEPTPWLTPWGKEAVS